MLLVCEMLKPWVTSLKGILLSFVQNDEVLQVRRLTRSSRFEGTCDASIINCYFVQLTC